MLGHARDAVIVIDPSGAICDVNAAAEEMYGYDKAELCGLPLERLRAPESPAATPLQMRDAAESGLLFESTHLRKDGTRFAVEVNSRGADLDGERFLVSIVRDISGRRQHEDERDGLLAELAQANRRLDSLVRIVSGALGTLERDEPLRDTFELLLQETDADAVLLLEAVDGGMDVRLEIGTVNRPMVGERFEPGEGFAGRVAAAGAPVYVPDVRDSSFALQIHAEAGFRSMFGVPMYVAGELFGVLELAWLDQQSITEDEIHLVQAAADRIVLAAANAQLYSRAKRAEALSAALNEVNSLVNASFDLSQTMNPALAICARALDCDITLVAFAEDGVWRARYASGVSLESVSLEYAHASATDGLQPLTLPAPEGDVHAWLERTLDVRESLIARLAVRGRQVGLLLFGRCNEGVGFDEVAREYADRFAGAIALAAANVDDFEAEHRIAETLQEALLTTPASVRGIEFSHLYRSATVRTRVGGDFYDLFELAHGRVGVVIGDVSGKGLEAAVLTSVIKDTIHALAHDVSSPAQVMTRANVALGRAAKLPEFASVFFGILETRTASMTYCCAGHPPAALLTADGDVALLETTSPVIGAFEDLEYAERSTPLAPGERVFLYTDGVTEARAADGSFFGEERLLDSLRKSAEAPVHELPEAVYDSVMRFTGGRLTDDLALLAFKLA